MSNELQGMWKEEVMAKFDVLLWHLPGGTEENHQNLSHFSERPGRRFNPSLRRIRNRRAVIATFRQMKGKIVGDEYKERKITIVWK
jgi:hypothetical protein